MTAKRFTTKNIICSNYCVWDNNGKPYGNDEVVELLNELHEENENLKQANSQLAKVNREGVKKVQKLAKENEQLKKQLQSEHQMLQNAILLERTRMGKNSLKQYKEAIRPKLQLPKHNNSRNTTKHTKQL